MTAKVGARPVLSPWLAESESRWGRAVHRRRGRIVVPSALAGLALAFSLPPWGWWPLAFVGAGALYVRLADQPARTRGLSGWVCGLGCYIPGLWWAFAFNWYGAAVLIGAEALSMGIAAVLVPPRRARPAAFVAAFTVLEALRMAWPFGGLPLGGVFLGQVSGPWLGSARIGGPLLLTAEVWLGGVVVGLLVEGAARWYRGDWLSGRFAAGLAATLAVLVGLGMAGALAPNGGVASGRVAVAAVQGGGRRGTSSLEISPTTVFRAQLAASARIPAHRDAPARLSARHERPALVLWPEDTIALSKPPLQGSPQAAIMARLARRLGSTVVAGVTIVTSPGRYRNEAVAWGPDGRVIGTYEKVHRVPFGEYVPFRSFFGHFASLANVPRDAIAGSGDGLLSTPSGKLGTMISYEVFFAERSRSPVRAGAQLLVVPTNTTSYATSQVPSQELAADRVQAVQAGRDLVQASPTGYSTLVDQQGNVRLHTPLNRREVLFGTAALRHGQTVYDRFGHLPVLVAAGLALVLAWAVALRPRRRRW